MYSGGGAVSARDVLRASLSYFVSPLILVWPHALLDAVMGKVQDIGDRAQG